MKRVFILIISIVIGLGYYSCTEDDNLDAGKTKLKLSLSKSSVFPFEDLKVSIDGNLDILQNVYDSIVWSADGVAYRFGQNSFLAEDDDRDIRVTDYRVGMHKVCASGYKDGTEISKDSVEYEVLVPNGDFLNVKWNTRKKDEHLYYTIGSASGRYLPVIVGKWSNWEAGNFVSLRLNYWVDFNSKGSECATMQFLPWSNSLKSSSLPDISSIDWFDQSQEGLDVRYAMEYNFLHQYLVDLYGLPKLAYAGDDVSKTTLTEEFDIRFKKQNYPYASDDYYPVEIWDAGYSHICLMRSCFGGKSKKGVSLVVAIPRKF